MILTTEKHRDDRLKLWIVLARAYSAVLEHDRRSVAAHGLSQGEFAVMEVLYHKGPLLLGQVQKKILVSSGGITYLVDRLEAKGLVERSACPGDRRSRYVALTKAGKSVMAKAFPAHAATLEKALGGLTSEEAKVAVRLLRKAGLHAEAILSDQQPSQE